MKRFFHRFFLLFLSEILIFLALSCGIDNGKEFTNSHSQGANQDCRIVQHVKGETCIPLNPQRIVTLDFNSLAVSSALDIKPIATWIVTEVEDNFRYFQGKMNGIYVLRDSVGQINLEKLLSLKPDLILCISIPEFQRVYKQLSMIAPTVILPWRETRGNWRQHLQDAGRVFDKTEMANQLMDEYDHRIQELKTLMGDRPPPKISFIFVADGRIVITRGKKSFAGGILEELGFLNPLFTESGDDELPISEEILPTIDSDILFVAPLKKDDQSVIQKLQQKPLWSKLKAVQNNQVYLVDFSVWRGLNIFAAHEILNDIEKYLINTP
ncbi:iron-siderophore ABC transporter substrate-binding protein [Chlorogloeopsis fritschii PCC 9212]|uniref:Iron siderophore-binding protein n=1 Tax=Chlorogloeopsis fritschii PCC 6912 TaxID=211165 RepID=A0A3S1APV5_CHLFR|nr:iron-siderophore ABC transporter substrate-binding protein [Chlorogloeopsis fritschii]RUR86990.1 iron siderophore-binding protein [Chlorogloeopsis fritschii PCC 6912]